MWKLLKFLPRNLISRWVGRLVHWKGPAFWNHITIAVFAAIYRIHLSEAEKSPWDYPSLGELFVRRLKPGVRPLATTAAVHCADSEILISGRIENGTCLQAKGKKYSVRDFLVDAEWIGKFEDGLFITYYLCPTDYHRVHSPVDGYIRKVTYVPGDLWPVHKEAVSEMEGLYLVNERVVVEIATDLGAVAVVFVGAMNVGSIELSFDSIVKGNDGQPFLEKVYEVPREIKKGEELGMFRMGSTVVTLFSPEFRRRHEDGMTAVGQVKVNSALTRS